MKANWETLDNEADPDRYLFMVRWGLAIMTAAVIGLIIGEWVARLLAG